jgi:hypothetical protein
MQGQGAIDRTRAAMQTPTDNLRGNAAGTMPVRWVCLQGPMNNSPQGATRSEVPVRLFHALKGDRDLNEQWRALRPTRRRRLGVDAVSLFGKETASDTRWSVLDGEERSLLTPTHEVPIEDVYRSWVFVHRQPAGSLAWTKTFTS